VQKWFTILLIVLSFFGLSHIFAADVSNTYRSQGTQTAPHKEGKAVHASEQATDFFNETNPVPISKPAHPTLYGVALGDEEKHVYSLLGQPERREPSVLGYDWLIYQPGGERYVQIGVHQGKVVDVYSNAPDASIGSVAIGMPYSDLTERLTFARKVTFAYANANIEITNQQTERPLFLDKETPIMYYLDKHDQGKVTGLRLIDKGMLLKGSFYDTKWTYQGDSPNFNPPVLSSEQQEQVDRAHELQILDLVNVIRHRHRLGKLEWNKEAADVARNHSEDMRAHQFFDHVSATTGLDPFQRLKQKNITYTLAGENIAAGFPDAIEAFHSWMNSASHRKNVLEKDFTQLGVGVTKDYYTQDFIAPHSS